MDFTEKPLKYILYIPSLKKSISSLAILIRYGHTAKEPVVIRVAKKVGQYTLLSKVSDQGNILILIYLFEKVWFVIQTTTVKNIKFNRIKF